MDGAQHGRSHANDGVVVCDVGGGNVAKAVYRVSMYAHRESDVGKSEERLLHEAEAAGDEPLAPRAPPLPRESAACH